MSPALSPPGAFRIVDPLLLRGAEDTVIVGIQNREQDPVVCSWDRDGLHRRLPETARRSSAQGVGPQWSSLRQRGPGLMVRSKGSDDPGHACHDDLLFLWLRLPLNDPLVDRFPNFLAPAGDGPQARFLRRSGWSRAGRRPFGLRWSAALQGRTGCRARIIIDHRLTRARTMRWRSCWHWPRPRSSRFLGSRRWRATFPLALTSLNARRRSAKLAGRPDIRVFAG